MIAIIRYNAGNTRSVQNALNRLGYESIITDDIEKIRAADKVILPGVGEASSAMYYLKQKGLDEGIISLTQPVLGICLGLQLMCNHTEENNTSCMKIFDTLVKRFPATGVVPHMGWNTLTNMNSDIFTNMDEKDNVYFVHSFYAELSLQTIATCDYILPFSAAIQKDNFYATQFHPEKSADAGENILKNFLAL